MEGLFTVSDQGKKCAIRAYLCALTFARHCARMLSTVSRGTAELPAEATARPKINRTDFIMLAGPTLPGARRRATITTDNNTPGVSHPPATRTSVPYTLRSPMDSIGMMTGQPTWLSFSPSVLLCHTDFSPLTLQRLLHRLPQPACCTAAAAP